ncbi:hypothetical protein ACDX78_08425 [Virgibacillus oceani]
MEAYRHTRFTGHRIIFDPVYNLQIIVLTNMQNNGPLDSGSCPVTGGVPSDIADSL